MPRRQRTKVSSARSRASYLGLRGGKNYLAFKDMKTGSTIYTLGLTRLDSKFKRTKNKIKIKRVSKK